MEIDWCKPILNRDLRQVEKYPQMTGMDAVSGGLVG